MSFTIQQIEQYAASKRFREGLAIPSEKSIKFSMLGQGEYNINYLFTHPLNGQKLVLRINTGSQMHLPDQIGYEYYALKLLENSTRTPKPYYLDSENHLLVMEYLPGRALDYRTDLKLAAECLAQIHSVSVPEECWTRASRWQRFTCGRIRARKKQRKCSVACWMQQRSTAKRNNRCPDASSIRNSIPEIF